MLVLAVFCCLYDLYVSHVQEFSYSRHHHHVETTGRNRSMSRIRSVFAAHRGQDWFALSNFLGLGSTGVYVDVGASLPFDYSNTATWQQGPGFHIAIICTQMPQVMLDRCLGWQGVCVEPNPHLSILLEAGAVYCSCRGHPLNFQGLPPDLGRGLGCKVYRSCQVFTLLD